MLTGTKAPQFVVGQIISMTWRSANEEDCYGERGSGHGCPCATRTDYKQQEDKGKQ